MRVLVLLLLAASLQAALITSAPGGGTTTVLTTITGGWDYAPSVVAGGFTVTGENVWYGDSSYGLASNGGWGDFAWVGGYCYSGDCTATIDLGGLYGSVGGFMNYAPGVGGPATIYAIAADGVTVLEWYDLTADAPISTPGGFNAGAFRGISRGSADIAFFRVSQGYLIMHDLTLADGGVVPEPATFGMAGLALGALVAWRKARK